MLQKLDADVRAEVNARRLSHSPGVRDAVAGTWVDGRMAWLAWLLVEVRQSKTEFERLDAVLTSLDSLLDIVAQAHPARFRSDAGVTGELGVAAAGLRRLLSGELATLPRPADEAAAIARRRQGGARDKRDAAAAAAWALVVAGTKMTHRAMFAFHALDAGLSARGMAKFEALTHWGWFEGHSLAVGAGEYLYTDPSNDSKADASGNRPQARAVKNWDEAIRSLGLAT